ncbi:MAG: hypothetical protein HN341_02300 [Verrucomicrobia bacterium]|jgi:hypothetical protein|nr:hypothetical protein [Verrucomicrobiota bacterium]
MAWRVDESIVRGEIDNRTRDRVTGKFWLVGREFPIVLTLAGNAHRDIAGCLLSFENPNARSGDTVSLSPIQMGTVGDMTASRKVRLFDIPLEEALARIERNEPVPEHMGNCVYLEWYSRANGRVVIESAEYTVTISPHQWRMTPEEEAEQHKQNAEAATEWVEHITAEIEGDGFSEDDDWKMDEFEWEKQLKESDAMTDRYGELLEKYMDDPDREAIIAREMGWSWLEEALADIEEEEPEEESAPSWLAEPGIGFGDEDDDFALVPDPLTEGTNWIRTDGDHIKHPLVDRAFRASTDMWHFCKDQNLVGDEGDPDVHDMLFQSQMLAAKLSGALNPLAYRSEIDGGFVVACLKRSLQYFDNAIQASSLVGEKNLVAVERVTVFRSELFEIRQEILRLMTHYRQLQ